MKRLLRRYTMLMILILVAFGWVALLSIPYGEAGTMRAADGANGRFTLVDEAAFPTITGYALLQDVGGKVIEGLQQDDFVLTEDGIPVDFTFTGAGEQPLTAMLVIDRSGSMEDERKMDGAIGAAQTFIDLLRPGRDTLGITTFSGDIETLLPIRALATVADQRAAGRLVDQIGPSGATRLNDAIIEAADDMQGTTGRRVIVALTDGVSDGDSATASDSIKRASDAGIPVYTIGLGSDVDNEQLQRIAQQTGGAYYFAPDADELAALYANLARALQNEYSFTYQSPTPNLDGTRRTLELNVARATAPFTISDDYAVSGVLVLQRSPWLLFGLGGTLLVLGIAPSVLGRRRKISDARRRSCHDRRLKRCVGVTCRAGRGANWHRTASIPYTARNACGNGSTARVARFLHRHVAEGTHDHRQRSGQRCSITGPRSTARSDPTPGGALGGYSCWW